MQINEAAILDDRGFIQINGNEAKAFLQNIVTNDIEKIANDSTIFSSILTPQGKYLYEFFILKLKNEYLLELNFTKDNIVKSIVNYRQVPYYSYYNHIKTLKKFNLYSSEISLFYLSEILKPFFIVMLAFVVVGFSGKFKRNENFFKILFIAILIGFLIFFLKEIITKFTISQNINFIFSYLIIFLTPFLIGLYQNIKIEND